MIWLDFFLILFCLHAHPVIYSNVFVALVVQHGKHKYMDVSKGAIQHVLNDVPKLVSKCYSIPCSQSVEKLVDSSTKLYDELEEAKNFMKQCK